MTHAPRPLTPQGIVDALTRLLADRAERHGSPLRVLLDGAPAAAPGQLADRLVTPLQALGHPALRVRASHFLRARSLRLEQGREDPDARYEDWLDENALRREVLEPLAPGGSRRWLPALRDPATDRARRLAREEAPARAVLLLDGELLLGRRLPAEVAVHLALSPAALARRTPEGERWALPAYARYDEEVDPRRTADVVLLVDHPDRPAAVGLG